MAKFRQWALYLEMGNYRGQTVLPVRQMVKSICFASLFTVKGFFFFELLMIDCNFHPNFLVMLRPPKCSFIPYTTFFLFFFKSTPPNSIHSFTSYAVFPF